MGVYLKLTLVLLGYLLPRVQEQPLVDLALLAEVHVHGHGHAEVEHVQVVFDRHLQRVYRAHFHDLAACVERETGGDALIGLEERDLQLGGAREAEAVLVELNGKAGEGRECSVGKVHVHVDDAVASSERARHFHAFAFLGGQPLLLRGHEAVGAHRRWAYPDPAE